MSIFVETTQLQDDTLLREQALLATLGIAHATAGQMQRSSTQVWGLPDDRLLALLNSDSATALDTQSFLDGLAEAINALLDAAVEDRPELAGTFPLRAPVGYGRSDVQYDPALPGFHIIPPP